MSQDTAAAVQILEVSVKAPSGALILDCISLALAAGEAVAFVGRSGAGKTTALKLLNGLAVPESGQVQIDGKSVASMDLIALRRSIGYVIQGTGLFPHRTVFENVAVVPRLLQWAEPKTRAAAISLLEALELPMERFGHRFPRSLSGGEQQRVGIARALIAEPRLLLCDEPFGALDPILRREQQEALLRLREARPITVVFVTHDLLEARRVADRVILFDQGRVVADAPQDRFDDVDHPLVRRFIAASVGR